MSVGEPEYVCAYIYIQFCGTKTIHVVVYIYIFYPQWGNNTKVVPPDSKDSNPVYQSSLKYLKLKWYLSSYTSLASSLGK